MTFNNGLSIRSARNILSVDKLYHGGPMYVHEPEMIIGEHTKDFGWGFYCTNIREQAERWARKKGKQKGFIGKVSVYSWNPGVMNTMNCLDFASVKTEEEIRKWLNFVIDCRGGKFHRYDIVAGPMADDQVWKPIQRYLKDRSEENYQRILDKAPFRHHTQQIVLCSGRALDSINLLREECYEV